MNLPEIKTSTRTHTIRNGRKVLQSMIVMVLNNREYIGSGQSEDDAILDALNKIEFAERVWDNVRTNVSAQLKK